MPWNQSPPARQRRPDILTHQWRRVRADVLRRDRHRCQVPTEAGTPCLAKANEVDHIQRGTDHRPENLRAICRAHHVQKSSQEGTNEKRRLARLSTRAVERHPFETWT